MLKWQEPSRILAEDCGVSAIAEAWASWMWSTTVVVQERIIGSHYLLVCAQLSH
jgi:hypothetical protein